MRIMGLKDAINYMLETVTQKALSDFLGVTINQVYKYSNGDTKSCRDDVVDRLYDNCDILLDYYTDEKQYLMSRKVRDAGSRISG